ncbi:MAG: hypothetical protein WCA30_06110 [Dermatophilaceae bacterium]
MSDDGSTDERSALAWIMSGTVGALVVGGLAKHLVDKRRERALAELEQDSSMAEPDIEDTGDPEEAEGHPT